MKVETFAGISGSVENLPQLPDGKFLPPMAYTCGELLLKKAIEKMGDPHRRVTVANPAARAASVGGADLPPADAAAIFLAVSRLMAWP